MSFAIIILFPTSFICGLSYYKNDETYSFDELNIYLLFLQFQIRRYE